jgi:hypothetical protein
VVTFGPRRGGPWVAALIAAGYRVYPINPLQVARYRERHGVSGAKSDTWNRPRHPTRSARPRRRWPATRSTPQPTCRHAANGGTVHRSPTRIHNTPVRRATASRPGSATGSRRSTAAYSTEVADPAASPPAATAPAPPTARRSGRTASSPIGCPRGLRFQVCLGRRTIYRRPRHMSISTRPNSSTHVSHHHGRLRHTA